MKLQHIQEARRVGGDLKKAVEFLYDMIEQERSYLEGEEAWNSDEDSDLVQVYEEMIDLIKSGNGVTPQDIKDIGDEVYTATGSGDTDLAQHVESTLRDLLEIK